jgi:hypothetical protein
MMSACCDAFYLLVALNGHGAMSVSCPLLRETHSLAALVDTIYEYRP